LPDNYKNKPNMKNLALSLIAIAALSLTSCLKTRTCTCIDKDASGNTELSQDYPIKSKKSTAETTCKNFQTSGAWDECKLK
jgi:hypothetical protein